MLSRRQASWVAVVVVAVTVVAWASACATPKKPVKPPKPVASVSVKSPAAPVRPAVAVRAKILDQVQGKWAGRGGGDDSGRWEWTIKGDTIAATTSNGDSYKGTLKFNEQASPTQVDVKLTDCSDPNLNNQTVLGIIRLEDRKLTLCVARPDDAARPTTFDESQGLLLVVEKQ